METTSPQPAQAQPHTTCSFENYSKYLKTEDMSTQSTSPAPSDMMQYPQASPKPEPIVVPSKPAKKRRSWGQELPKPKTNLPPRKRAKTEEEKEQRRIERITRNRAAAHNSRERKRQETEDLAVALARANAELDAYRQLHGPLPSHIVLPEVRIATESCDSVTASTPAPSLVESHGTHGDAPSPSSPLDNIFQFHGVPLIKEELDEADNDSTEAMIGPVCGQFDEKSSVAVLPGEMQDSAEILSHDLPRHSNSTCHSSITPTTQLLANLLVTILSMHFHLCYRTIATALQTEMPSRMQAMIRRSEKASSIGKTSSTTVPLGTQLQYGHEAPHYKVATVLNSLLSQQSSLDEMFKAKRLTSREVLQADQTQKALLKRAIG